MLSSEAHSNGLGGTVNVLMYDGSVKCADALCIGDVVMGDDCSQRRIVDVSMTDTTGGWVLHDMEQDVCLGVVERIPNTMVRNNMQFSNSGAPTWNPYAFGYLYVGAYRDRVDEPWRVDVVDSKLQEYLLETRLVRYSHAYTFFVLDVDGLYATLDSAQGSGLDSIPVTCRANSVYVLYMILGGVYDAVGRFEVDGEEMMMVLSITQSKLPFLLHLHRALGLSYGLERRQLSASSQLWHMHVSPQYYAQVPSTRYSRGIAVSTEGSVHLVPAEDVSVRASDTERVFYTLHFAGHRSGIMLSTGICI